MNFLHCKKSISDKPWLHLSKCLVIDSETNSSEIERYICGYSCFKRLSQSNTLPLKLWDYIINKEDYKGLIRPEPRIMKKSFEYLTLNEIQELNDIEREKYYLELDNQIHINPILSKIQDEIIDEDMNSYMIENDISDSEFIDDY